MAGGATLRRLVVRGAVADESFVPAARTRRPRGSFLRRRGHMAGRDRLEAIAAAVRLVLRPPLGATVRRLQDPRHVSGPRYWQGVVEQALAPGLDRVRR